MKLTSIAAFAIISSIAFSLSINPEENHLHKRVLGSLADNLLSKAAVSADAIHPPQRLQRIPEGAAPVGNLEGAAPLEAPAAPRILDNSPDIQRSPHKNQQLLDLQRL